MAIKDKRQTVGTRIKCAACKNLTKAAKANKQSLSSYIAAELESRYADPLPRSEDVDRYIANVRAMLGKALGAEPSRAAIEHLIIASWVAFQVSLADTQNPWPAFSNFICLDKEGCPLLGNAYYHHRKKMFAKAAARMPSKALPQERLHP